MMWEINRYGGSHLESQSLGSLGYKPTQEVKEVECGSIGLEILSTQV